jgi:TetR/AcrR family transcriptional repressor of nem operon
MRDAGPDVRHTPGAEARTADTPAESRRRTARAAAQATRASLINAAYHDMRRSGYQGAGIGDILTRTGLTKGAFYHHFDSKRDLGLAVLDDCAAADLARWWTDPLAETDDPLGAILGCVRARLADGGETGLSEGSPFATLTADMAPLDDAFRARLDGLYRAWRKAVARALRRGQQSGSVRTDVDADAVAALIVAAIEGLFLQVKAKPRLGAGETTLAGLSGYLETLRA